MEQYPTALLDTARLLASKKKMKDAIKAVWHEQPKLRSSLAQAYLRLSQFQDGIGETVVLDSKLSDDITPGALLGRKGESFRQWSMWSKVSTAEIEILEQEWENFERSNAA